MFYQLTGKSLIFQGSNVRRILENGMRIRTDAIAVLFCLKPLSVSLSVYFRLIVSFIYVHFHSISIWSEIPILISRLRISVISKGLMQHEPCYRGCLIWLRQNDPIGPIWVKVLNHSWKSYDWHANSSWNLTFDIDTTERPWHKLAQIWMRHPKFSYFVWKKASQSYHSKL